MGKADHRHTAFVEAYVAVGSNVRPESNIRRALALLRDRVAVIDSSPFFLTEPIGAPGAPKFVNGVWRIHTDLDPEPLKYDVLKTVERALGRRRTAKQNTPREIDLDLILYGDTVVCTPRITLPDPDILRRGHIAVPLAALAPDLVLPDVKIRIADHEVAQNREGIEPLDELSSQLKRWLMS